MRVSPKSKNLAGHYIKSEFWCDIESRFNLRSNHWDALTAPPEEADVDDAYDSMLPELVGMINSDNPAQRSTGLDRLESYMETAEKIPLRQLYGLLLLSQESTKMTYQLSIRMQWVLVRYLIKWKYDEEWQEMWTICCDRFEECTAQKWRAMRARTPRNIFVTRFKPVVRKFLHAESLDTVIQNIADKEPLNELALSELLKKSLGQALFSAEADQNKWSSFLGVCRKRLDDLIHSNWTPEEASSFHQAMRNQCRLLLQSGMDVPDKIELSAVMFGENWKMTVPSIWDVPTRLYHVLLRQIAVQNKQVRLYPWEDHLIKAFSGVIPGIPEAMKLPQDLIGHMSAARDVGVPLVQNYTSYGTMLKELKDGKDDLNSLDIHHHLDVEFLEHKMSTVTEKLVRGTALSYFPDLDIKPGAKLPTLADAENAHNSLQTLMRSSLVQYSPQGPASLFKSLSGATVIVRAMLDGQSLLATQVLTSSEFHKQIVARCANYLHCEKVTKNKKGGQNKVVFGAEAMAIKLETLRAELSADKVQNLEHIKVFRQFRWLLTAEWDREITKIQKEQTRKRKFMLEGRMIKDEEEAAAHKKAKKAPAKGSLPEKAVVAGVCQVGGASASKDAPAPAADPEESEPAAGANAKSKADFMALFYPKMQG